MEKINDFKVKLYGDAKSGKAPRGEQLFNIPFSQIFMCSRKKSGKTVVIENVIRECINPGVTHVHFFVPTIKKKDSGYEKLIQFLKKQDNPMSIHTSIFEKVPGMKRKVNVLERMIEDMENGIDPIPNIKGKEKKTKKNLKKKIVYCDNLLECKVFGYTYRKNGAGPDEIFEQPKEKHSRSKYEELDHLFVFDDCGSLLKNKVINDFCCKNRHFKCKNLIASQHWNHVALEARLQLDYCLLFKGHRKEKLEQIFENLDCRVPFEVFHEIYKKATEGDYNFLYVDRANCQFRKNFDELIHVDENANKQYTMNDFNLDSDSDGSDSDDFIF